MKKIFFILITLSASLSTYSQVYKSGPITLPETWSGTVYLSDDVTITSVVTINVGTRILYKGNDVKLIVDGSGSIVANGTSGNEILFSADDDEDGNYGENGERGLKLKFYPTSGSKGSSSFGYCIFEYIDCSLVTGGDAYGSLDACGGTITISNSIIRNSKSDYGGAIFIRSGAKLTLDKCTIENNSADILGGGLYFGASSGTIKNCIFRNNSAPSGGGIYVYNGGPVIQNSLIYSNTASSSGSGIFLNQANSAMSIINTTCAKNSTSGTVKDFQFSGLSGQLPKIINSIIWGSDIGTIDAARITVTNSAIQGFTNVGDHTSSISLSSNNDDPDGPNFNATDGSDWSVKFISPCRDAGSTPSPEVLTDFPGNSRIGPYDIGAYEVQYSRWKTTAGTNDWNTGDNWDGGVPSLTRDVIIPTGASLYPTSSPGPDFTIGSGKQMIIEPGARVTLNSLTNNGILKLNHNATDFASLILNSYTRGTGGTEEIQLYLEGGGSELLEDYKWHYISSPVTSLSTDLFTVNTDNLAQFIETRVSTSLMQGWVAYDGYVYSTAQFTGPTFASLTPGKGYNYFYEVNDTYTFGGQFNTSDLPVSLSYTTGTPASMHGFNLLGNPFSSGLNWDDIIDGTYFPYPASTSKGLYFTRNNEQCSYIAGVGVPSDVSGIIPPMQGFFNKTYSTGNSITLPAAARTHNNIHSRYKGETIIPLVRLAIFEDQISNDETVVRFNDLAKSDLDNDYDAIKMFLSSNKTSIHTSMEGTDYAINGQPFPELTLEIPVVVNVISSGTHKISASQLQGLDNYNVYLTDKTTGFTADLKTSPDVTFSASAGSLNDRFILKISNVSTGTEDLFSADNSFNIYQSFDNINIQTLADSWDGKTGSVTILDISGKNISDLRNTEFSKTSVTQLQAPALKGLYFIEIRSGKNRFAGKVMIK